MAIITKVVSNTLNQAIFLTDVIGFNEMPVKIPALASSLDLSTLASLDALATSYNLPYLVSEGVLTVGASFSTSAEAAGEAAVALGAGVTHTFTTITGITVTNGIVTSITGS